MDKSPSEGFTLEELRSEFDWMHEFQSRMAENIRNDPDVHSLAGYVSKLEEQNAKLRELVGYFLRCERCLCDGCPLNEHGLCSILEKAEELGFEVPE